jgi:PAS domain S-box-containing protein
MSIYENLKISSFQNIQLKDLEELKDKNLLNIQLKDLKELKDKNLLNIAGNLLGDEAVNILISAVHIISLDISGNNIASNGACIISKHKSLLKLNISYNKIGNVGFASLVQNNQLEKLIAIDTDINSLEDTKLRDNLSLKTLIIKDNLVNDCGAKELSLNKYLTELDVSNNNIGDPGAIDLASNKNLITLDVSRNNINLEGAQAFAENTSLKMLKIEYNNLGTEGAILIAKNKTLKSLNISGNIIFNEGCSMLLSNTSFEDLDISYNQISDSGVEIFEQNNFNTNLFKLNLNFNQISQKGAKILSKVDHLQWLGLAYNFVSNEGAVDISHHKNLTYLDLTANKIDVEGTYDFPNNNSIKTLKLSYNLIGDSGSVVISLNSSIENLSLHYNQIGPAGAMILAKNRKFKRLDISCNPIGSKGRNAINENKELFSPMHTNGMPINDIVFGYKNMSFLLLQDFLCACDNECKIVFINPIFARTFGYDTDELLGKFFIELFYPGDKMKGMKKFDMHSTINSMNSEDRYLRKDGGYLLLRWTCQLSENFFYVVGIDVTEQRKKYQSFQLNEARKNALRLKEFSDFVSHLCHELRNPLNGMFGITNIMQGSIHNVQDALENKNVEVSKLMKEELMQQFNETSECYKNIITCLEYQKSILDDNLDLIKIIENKLIIKKDIFDLCLILQDIYKMFIFKAKEKDIKLNLNLPRELFFVKGDVLRIKQIIINLVVNAIKFTEKGVINISLKLKNIHSLFIETNIIIDDTGVGIDKEYLPLLFSRFSSLNNTYNANYSGSGLGLCLAKKLINFLGGSITVASEKEKGSIFTCSITFEVPSEEEVKVFKKESLNSNLLLSQSMDNKCLDKVTILIVEDNTINSKILKKCLEKRKAKVIIASDGQFAVDSYKRFFKVIDVILMDIIMPIKDGLTATREIRTFEILNGFPSVLIIGISGQALEIDSKNAFDAGMNEYLIKPFNSEKILMSILKLLKR